MALEKRGAYWYGDSQDDIRGEIARYSELNGYPADRFADARCTCGGRLFALETDETEGVAVRICTSCDSRHVMVDGTAHADSTGVR